MACGAHGHPGCWREPATKIPPTTTQLRTRSQRCRDGARPACNNQRCSPPTELRPSRGDAGGNQRAAARAPDPGGGRERVAWVRALTQGDLRAMLAAALRLHAWAPDDKTWHDQVLHGLTVTLLRRGSASATMPGGSGAGRRRHSPLGWMDSIGPPQSCSTRTSSRWRPIPHSRSPRAETVGRRNEQGRVDFSSPTNVGNILITDHTDEHGSIRAARIRSVMIHVIRGWIEWECSEGGRKPALLRHYDKLPRKYPKRVLD